MFGNFRGTGGRHHTVKHWKWNTGVVHSEITGKGSTLMYYLPWYALTFCFMLFKGYHCFQDLFLNWKKTYCFFWNHVNCGISPLPISSDFSDESDSLKGFGTVNKTKTFNIIDKFQAIYSDVGLYHNCTQIWLEHNNFLQPQQNSYSISHLLDTVTTQGMVTVENCPQHSDWASNDSEVTVLWGCQQLGLYSHCPVTL